MTTLSTPQQRTAHVLRFDRVQRSAHWAVAVLFTSLLFTADVLYFGSFFGVTLPRHPIEQIHLWSGLALAVPVVISLIGPWGRQMRRDVRRVNYWTRAELRWLRTLGRSPLDADKFNPGQKLNTIFTGATIVIMLVTGLILQWFRLFTVPLRQGATFVHDLFALALLIVIVGHVVMALTHRDALRSILRGWVTTSWARRYAPAWLRESTPQVPLDPP